MAATSQKVGTAQKMSVKISGIKEQLSFPTGKRLMKIF